MTSGNGISDEVAIREHGSGLLGPFACSVRTRIDICAPADGVWSILTDASSYGDWNPFIRELSGPLALGHRLSVGVGEDANDLLRFDVRIARLDEARELRWTSRYGLPWLVDTAHDFILEPIEPGKTRLHHGEAFWGLLIPRMVRPNLDDIARGFSAMNKALKSEAEAGMRPQSET